LQQEGGHSKKVVVTLRQPMGNNGYKHEGNNYKHEENRFVMKLYFIEVLSKDWKVIIVHPLHVYLGCHHRSFLSFYLSLFFMIIVSLSILRSCSKPKLANNLGLSTYLGVLNPLLPNLNR
jgi:hypothetical protein